MTLRDTLLGRIENIDFASLSRDEYERWVDALPMGEFSALLSIHDEFRMTGRVRPADTEVTPQPIEPLGDDFVPYNLGGDLPTKPEAIIWTLYRDGETEGPNRADHFLWGDTGDAEIIAWAFAVVGTSPRGASATPGDPQ